MRNPEIRLSHLLLSAALLLLAVGARGFVNPEGEHLGGVWRMSPDQSACETNLRCVEWCERIPTTGQEFGTGEFCCVPDALVNSEDPACDRRPD